MTATTTIFDALEKMPPAFDAVTEFTRDKMWRLRHIPMRYFVDETKAADFAVLAGELNNRGYIALDKAGEPAVLSGEPPVLPHPSED